MTISQTVEIPDNHRLTIDVPRDVPSGPVILTFTPANTKAAGIPVQNNENKKIYSLAVDMTSFVFDRNEVNER